MIILPLVYLWWRADVVWPALLVPQHWEATAAATC